MNKPVTKRIDWASAKTWFLAEHTRTLGEVAAYCKANPATVRAKAGADRWVEERNTQATLIEKKATERIQADLVDRAARCNEETILVARAIRKKAAAFLKRDLTPNELNAMASAHEKAVTQERLALGMSTSASDVKSTIIGAPVINMTVTRGGD